MTTENSATPDVLVTGASGVLGGAVVTELVRRGHRVRAMTRRLIDLPPRTTKVRADLATGEGLDDAVAGVATIVHCATDPVRHKAVDEEGTRRLTQAAKLADEPHLIYVSNVGVDEIPYNYYRSKYEAEQVVQQSGLPWTIIRSGEFHDFVLALAQQFARPPLVVVPRLQVQPVDVRDVAERIGELVDAGPSGRVHDFAGPATYRGEALLRRYLAHVGVHRSVVAATLPGAVWRALREGANLVQEPTGGHRGFFEFLDEQSVVDDGKVLVRSTYAERWAE
jgi:uncharacterized protein YbjT (DUF2867 family)